MTAMLKPTPQHRFDSALLELAGAVRIEVPLRLVSEANAHQHWRLRAKRAKQQRTLVTLGLMVMAQTRKPKLPAVVTITRIAPRRLDCDNNVGSAKHARDAIAKWLGIDDRSPLVSWRYAQEQQSKTYAVRIEITPATAEGGTT